MIVRCNVAKLNDNDCEQINEYLEQGMSAIESFDLLAKKNRHNPKKLIGYETRDDKWFWIFKLLESELKPKNYTLV